MLRMYECNWCFKKQVKDDDEIILVPDPERMVMHKRAVCSWNCRSYINRFKPIMHPMIKDVNGDWIKSTRKVRRSRMEVVAPIIWH